jgi:hypothetical protein
MIIQSLFRKPVLFAMAPIVILLLGSGCVAPENESQPWNKPAGWENDMPTRPTNK